MTRTKTLPLLGAALILAAIAAGVGTPPTPGRAQPSLDYYQVLSLDRTAFRFRPYALLPVGDDGGQRLVYGDRYGFVRVAQVTRDDTQEIWRSRFLDGAVLEVLVEDLEGDGRVEIIARSLGGRIFVFDDQYNLRWENLREDYNEIVAFTIANMDDDPAYELILLADGRIDYLDGSTYNREFRSTQTYTATEVTVGNVDVDNSLELVLNSGVVVDALRGEPEWQTEPFGDLIELLDIDGDGMQEIIGYTYGQPARIYDADEQEEKPLL